MATGFLLCYNRQVIKKLKQVGATSPENAKTTQEAGITTIEARSIPRLKFVGQVIEIIDEKGSKRYYVTVRPGVKKAL
jgi:hypothetical protein